MTTTSLSPVDVRVREAVRRQLEWDPEVDASAVGVSAKDGAVVLTGYIDTYPGKLAAERAAKRVKGVRAVANDLQVRLRLDRTDADIASDAARALDLHDGVPAGVQAVVHDGHIVLTGRVPWRFQKEEAERVVRHVRGVRDVTDRIDVAPAAVERDVRRRIVQALHRNAEVDAARIHVAVSDRAVTLSGTVSTWKEREAAARAVSGAAGVQEVVNTIAVEPADLPPDDVDEIC